MVLLSCSWKQLLHCSLINIYLMCICVGVSTVFLAFRIVRVRNKNYHSLALPLVSPVHLMDQSQKHSPNFTVVTRLHGTDIQVSGMFPSLSSFPASQIKLFVSWRSPSTFPFATLLPVPVSSWQPKNGWRFTVCISAFSMLSGHSHSKPLLLHRMEQSQDMRVKLNSMIGVLILS